MIKRVKSGLGMNELTSSYVVDEVSEIALLPTTTSIGKGQYADLPVADMGSTAICGNAGAGVSYYMLFSFGWIEM